MKTSERTNLMTKKELAAYLNVSPRTVERYVAAGAIPFVRLPIGGKLRFNEKDIKRWIEKLTERR